MNENDDQSSVLCGFERRNIINKLHTKDGLKAWTKERLVEHIVCLEYNIEAMQESFEIQYMNCVRMIDSMSMVNDGFKKSRMLAMVSEGENRNFGE